MESFHFPWNEIGELEDLKSEYNALVGHGFELRKHLEISTSQKKSLHTLLKRININPEKHSKPNIEDLKQEIRRVDQIVKQLEVEISSQKLRVWEMARRIKIASGDASTN